MNNQPEQVIRGWGTRDVALWLREVSKQVVVEPFHLHFERFCSCMGILLFYQTCLVQLRGLGLMAYWYTGSAFHQIPQSIIFIVPC